jgi:MFS family permease
MTRRQEVLVWVTAAIGFAFDIYELLMLPLVVGPALDEFGIAAGSAARAGWVGRMFFVPAVAGGLFGLAGGYLTDRLGRCRVLTWSIYLYAFSALAAAFSTSPEMLLALRTLTFVGVCVEFVAATAWLAELYEDPGRRQVVLGYTQALSSLGGFMVTAAYHLCVRHADELPAILGGHSAWRYTLASGLIPALPLMLVRPFLPESPRWLSMRRAGTLGRPSIAELFRPALARTTIVATVLVACNYAVAFGALQHLPRIGPGLAGVRELPRPEQQVAVSHVQYHQEAGGLAGRVALAWLAVRLASRRTVFRALQIPGLVVVPIVFLYAAAGDLGHLRWGVFIAAFFTIGLFSFWGNYLPLAYPVHLRGTGESFAANVGGRMIGTSAAWATAWLADSAALVSLAAGWSPPRRLALAAALVALAAHAVAAVAVRWLPEPGETTRA